MVVQEKLTQREEYQMPMGMTSDENDHESGLEELDKMEALNITLITDQ